ncbi:Agamous MADS-box protein AGL3 [Spatholobus suberectus]|nr:Agamous MADS-box protein AGL3 [Spatholobus suberectus]
MEVETLDEKGGPMKSVLKERYGSRIDLCADLKLGRYHADILSIIVFHLLQIAALEKANDVNNVVTQSMDCDKTDGVTHNLLTDF